MQRTRTKHIVRHMQKPVVQWSVISKFTCTIGWIPICQVFSQFQHSIVDCQNIWKLSLACHVGILLRDLPECYWMSICQVFSLFAAQYSGLHNFFEITVTLSRWYSFESSYWLLSDEYQYAGFQSFFSTVNPWYLYFSSFIHRRHAELRFSDVTVFFG